MTIPWLPSTPRFYIMMLHNPLATVAQLAAIADEDDSDVLSGSRASLRFRTVRAMQVAGILLHLGQEIIAKSIITFDRYWLCAAPLICQQGLVVRSESCRNSGGCRYYVGS